MHVVSPSPRDSDLNPIHALAFTGKQTPSQEVHIVKVTDDSVKLERGPVPEPVLHKVGVALAQHVPRLHNHHESSGDSSYGPPPPSPPSSVEGELPPSRRLANVSSASTSQPDVSPRPPPITFEEPTPVERASSSSREQRSRIGAHSLRHRSSAETRSSLRTSQSAYAQSTLDTPLTDEPPAAVPPSLSKSLPSRSAGSGSGAGSHVSVDGYLQPPTPHRPSRRNTIGAAAPSPPLQSSSPPRVTRMATMHAGHPTAFEDVGELADDIEQQAEQIRRERKRVKAQQEAERALTRSATIASRVDDGPLVGNLIGEDHVNYVLMYNMLTGIRIAVSANIECRRHDGWTNG